MNDTCRVRAGTRQPPLAVVVDDTHVLTIEMAALPIPRIDLITERTREDGGALFEVWRGLHAKKPIRPMAPIDREVIAAVLVRPGFAAITDADIGG